MYATTQFIQHIYLNGMIVAVEAAKERVTVGEDKVSG